MLEGAKLIGAGAATIALAGAAIGIGNVFSSLIHSVARNPSLAKQLFGYAMAFPRLNNISFWLLPPSLLLLLSPAKAIFIKLLFLICILSLISFYIPTLSPLLDKVGIVLVGRGLSAFGAPGWIASLVVILINTEYSPSIGIVQMMKSSDSGSGYTRALDSPSLSEEYPILRMPTPEYQEMLKLSTDFDVGVGPSNPNQGVEAATSNPPAPLSVEETNRRIREETDKRILDLKNDPYPTTVAYRNALIKQEEIVGVMTQIINENGIRVTDPRDIRNGVDLFLTELMDKYGEPRRRGLKKILVDLAENRVSGQYFSSIMREIQDH